MQNRFDKVLKSARDLIGSTFSGIRLSPETRELLHQATREWGWKFQLWIPASVLSASAFLLPPLLLQFFTENATSLASIDGPEFLRRLILFGLLISGCLWLGVFCSGILTQWLRLQIGIYLRRAVLANLLEARLEKIDTANRSEWMTQLTRDLADYEEFLFDTLPNLIKNLTILLGAVLLFFVNVGWITWIPLLAALGFGFLDLQARRRIEPGLRDAREIEGNVFQTIIEASEGIRTIRSSGGESAVKRILNEQLNNLGQVGSRNSRTLSALTGLNEMASQLMITLVLALAAFRMRGASLTVNEILVLPFYIHLFVDSAKSLFATVQNWNRRFNGMRHFAAILLENFEKIDRDFTIKGILGVTALSGSGIEMRYGREPPILSGLDIQVSRGELVAILGPSGSGKSTLLEALAGLREHSAGEWFLSTKVAEKENVPMVPCSLCAFVEQKPYLFAGSIRNNIKLGQPALFDIEIKAVIKAVGLESAVAERGGLDAVLSDGEIAWSFGQRYRLALCRALVTQRPFVMLDEPFAALDDQSLNDVVRTLNLARKSGAGIVVATHLLPENLQVDRVIELVASSKKSDGTVSF